MCYLKPCGVCFKVEGSPTLLYLIYLMKKHPAFTQAVREAYCSVGKISASSNLRFLSSGRK